MTRLRRRLGRAHPVALTVIAGAALAAGGCGGGAARTNGLETMPAAKVQRLAVAALRSAGSAHVKGNSVMAGAPMRLDLRFDGSSSTGSVVAGGLRIAITRIGEDFFLKADRTALQKLGASPRVRRAGADRWLKLGRQQITQWKGLSLAELAGQLADQRSPVDARVTQATLDGKRVVVVCRQDGSKLYVSNTGAAYPLRGDYEGAARGRLEFSEYGARFAITAPKAPIDVSKLVNEEG